MFSSIYIHSTNPAQVTMIYWIKNSLKSLIALPFSFFFSQPIFHQTGALICLTSFTGLSRIRVKSNKARETPTWGPPLSPQHCLPSEHWVVPRYSRFFKKCCVGAVVFCYLFYPVYLASAWDPSIPAPESASFCNAFRELLRMPGYPWLLACWICPFLFAVLPVFKVLFCASALFLSHNVFSFKVTFVCL